MNILKMIFDTLQDLLIEVQNQLYFSEICFFYQDIEPEGQLLIIFSIQIISKQSLLSKQN